MYVICTYIIGKIEFPLWLSHISEMVVFLLFACKECTQIFLEHVLRDAVLSSECQ